MISLQFACSHFILSRNVIDTCLFDKPEKRSPGIAYRISLAIYRLGFIWSLLKVMSIAAFCNASWFTTWVVCFISNLIEVLFRIWTGVSDYRGLEGRKKPFEFQTRQRIQSTTCETSFQKLLSQDVRVELGLNHFGELLFSVHAPSNASIANVGSWL